MQNKPKFGGYELAEEITGLKRSTLYTKVNRRTIPHYRLSGRCVRFSADELEAWIRERAVPTWDELPPA